MTARAAALYKAVDLESAPKHKIVERLFGRFARDVEQARTALAAKDIPGKAAAIDHALRIVAELDASLDHEKAPELCQNLAALYEYVSQRLIEANATLEVTALDAGARIMANLDEAFRQAHATL